MPEKEMTIGERIRFLRKKEGLSQTDLAAKIGVIKQTLYKYETGIVTNIPSEKIEEIASVLGVTPAYLMGWEELDTASYSFARHKSINDMLDKLSPAEVQLVEGIIRQILTYKNHQS